MKTSIFKRTVSFLAVAAIALTSTVVAMAENVYTSENGNQWASPSTTNGCVHTLNDGTLTSTRTIFRSGVKDGDNSYTTYHKVENGVWNEVYRVQSAPTAESWSTKYPGVAQPTVCETTWDVKKETETGTARVKFDFKFDGGIGQTVYAYFRDYTRSNSNYTGQTGLKIRATGVDILNPKGNWGNAKSYAFGKNVWYSCEMTLDLDAAKIDYSITEKGDDDVCVAAKYTYTSGDFGDYKNRNKISGITFRSAVDQDSIATSADMIGGAAADVTESVWHIANVEYDAFSKSNYEISSVYKSADGVVSNVETADIPFRGFAVNRLTNIADPANASFITASYDGTGRMENVAVTPLANALTQTNHSTITGATVKSFVLDTDTAAPYAEVYQKDETAPEKTVRSIDFNDGCTVNTLDNKNNIINQGYYLHNLNDTDVSMGIENGALRVERSVFRKSSQGYHYDENGNIVLHTKADGSKADDAVDHYGSFYMMRFDKVVSTAHVSMKFKFAGLDDQTGDSQMITITFGKDNGNPGEYLVRITRNKDGSGNMRNGFSGMGATWNAGEMKADTWYSIDFTYTYDATTETGSVTDGTLVGDGINKSFKAAKVAYDIPKTFNFLAIFSHREYDRAATADSGVSTKTSVWYIDDLKVEY